MLQLMLIPVSRDCHFGNHAMLQDRVMQSEFGNTLADLRRVCVVGGILAAINFVVLFFVAYANGELGTDWPMVVTVPLVVGGILPLLVFPTCLFSIRVDEKYITHLFCRRHIVSLRPLSELQSVRKGVLFAVVFRFADGSSIRFFGAHMRTIQALRERIHEVRQEFRGFG